MCVLCVDMTRDAMIDTGRAKYRAWGDKYVITSLLENDVILETIKKRGEPPLEATSPTLIHGHTPCLSGRSPSSAVHHFGVRKAAECAPGQLPLEVEQRLRRVARAGEAQRVARQRLAAHAATQGTRVLSLSGVRGHAGYAQDVCGEGSRA
jgi:hypothetical protein